MSEQDLFDLFESCGEIEMICLQINKLGNGQFGHIRFCESETVDKAVNLFGRMMKGSAIRLDFAEDRPVSAWQKSRVVGLAEEAMKAREAEQARKAEEAAQKALASGPGPSRPKMRAGPKRRPAPLGQQLFVSETAFAQLLCHEPPPQRVPAEASQTFERLWARTSHLDSESQEQGRVMHFFGQRWILASCGAAVSASHSATALASAAASGSKPATASISVPAGSEAVTVWVSETAFVQVMCHQPPEHAKELLEAKETFNALWAVLFHPLSSEPDMFFVFRGQRWILTSF